jgi:hypothetical protein
MKAVRAVILFAVAMDRPQRGMERKDLRIILPASIDYGPGETNQAGLAFGADEGCQTLVAVISKSARLGDSIYNRGNDARQ